MSVLADEEKSLRNRRTRLAKIFAVCLLVVLLSGMVLGIVIIELRLFSSTEETATLGTSGEESTERPSESSSNRSSSPLLYSNISTVAGSTAGYADGPGTTSKFSLPSDVSISLNGTVYVSDSANHVIRQISPSGYVSTIAGSGSSGSADGYGTSARFSNPLSLQVDSSNNIYVVDRGNHKIRKISPSGAVSTIAGAGSAGYADGQGIYARFNTPWDLTLDQEGNLYVTDNWNFLIRKISPSGYVSTLAGQGSPGYVDGPAQSARFYWPQGIASDNNGSLYITDVGNRVVRKVNYATGVVSTLAGAGYAGFADGQGTAAVFSKDIWGIAVDLFNNVYVGDATRIRKITPDRNVSTIVGSVSGYQDGPLNTSLLSLAWGMAIDTNGYIYIADSINNRIRKIT